MSCDAFNRLMSAYLDGELPADERRRFEDHVESCEVCTRQLAELRALTEDLNMMRFKEPEDEELQRYWAGVYNRLERGIGWILISAGAIVLLCYGAFQFIADLTVSLPLKIGLCVLIAGLVVLFVSLLRERLRIRPVDRYSKEVKR